MATTSIWRVHGWLGKVVIYIENPEKTTNPMYYKHSQINIESLCDVIDYASDPNKTNLKIDNEGIEIHQQFVSCINCLPATARDEMIAVKKRFGKDEGVIAYHGYQSFAPGEINAETAHEIGIKLAKILWGDRYQVIIATHLDKQNHLHNHFVVNNVSFVDGIKYHRTAKDYYEMQKVSDKLCLEYGLSIVSEPHYGKSKHYSEWKAEQEQRPTWRGLIRLDIDETIKASATEQQFIKILKDKGYEIKFGKDISVRPPGKERFVRLARNFGEEYSIESIRKRILSQQTAKLPSKPTPQTKQYRLKGKIKRKVRGYRALYFYYCYRLGIFPKKQTAPKKQVHFLLREDLLKLNNISKEVKLLIRNRIDTAEQLSLYKNQLEVKIEQLSAERKAMNQKDIKQELTVQIKSLRCEIRLCDDIANRSSTIIEKLKKIDNDESIKRKEKNREHIR